MAESNWLGTVSTNWEDAGNWSLGYIPNSTSTGTRFELSTGESLVINQLSSKTVAYLDFSFISASNLPGSEIFLNSSSSTVSLRLDSSLGTNANISVTGSVIANLNTSISSISDTTIDKLGLGTVNLNYPNYFKNFNINSGTLGISDSGALGCTTSGYLATVAPGGTLKLNPVSGGLNTPKNIILNNGNITNHSFNSTTINRISGSVTIKDYPFIYNTSGVLQLDNLVLDSVDGKILTLWPSIDTKIDIKDISYSATPQKINIVKRKSGLAILTTSAAIGAFEHEEGPVEIQGSTPFGVSGATYAVGQMNLEYVEKLLVNNTSDITLPNYYVNFKPTKLIYVGSSNTTFSSGSKNFYFNTGTSSNFDTSELYIYSGNLTIASNISSYYKGTVDRLIKSGPGNLIFSGIESDYTIPTHVSDGFLKLTTEKALGCSTVSLVGGDLELIDDVDTSRTNPVFCDYSSTIRLSRATSGAALLYTLSRLYNYSNTTTFSKGSGISSGNPTINILNATIYGTSANPSTWTLGTGVQLNVSDFSSSSSGYLKVGGGCLTFKNSSTGDLNTLENTSGYLVFDECFGKPLQTLKITNSSDSGVGFFDTSGSPQFDILLNSDVSFNVDVTATYGELLGNISATSSAHAFRKRGLGSLYLYGNLNYTSATEIYAGNLVLTSEYAHLNNSSGVLLAPKAPTDKPTLKFLANITLTVPISSMAAHGEVCVNGRGDGSAVSAKLNNINTYTSNTVVYTGGSLAALKRTAFGSGNLVLSGGSAVIADKTTNPSSGLLVKGLIIESTSGSPGKIIFGE